MGDKVKGGLADGMSIEDIAKRHKVDVSIAKEALKNGITVEMEHTSDKDLAKEIAMDHLYEDINYYDKLKIIERRLVKKILNK
jgi:hypothetical protein